MTVPEVWKACRDEAENGRSPFGLEGEKSADRHEVMFVGQSSPRGRFNKQSGQVWLY